MRLPEAPFGHAGFQAEKVGRHREDPDRQNQRPQPQPSRPGAEGGAQKTHRGQVGGRAKQEPRQDRPGRKTLADEHSGQGRGRCSTDITRHRNQRNHDNVQPGTRPTSHTAVGQNRLGIRGEHQAHQSEGAHVMKQLIKMIHRSAPDSFALGTRGHGFVLGHRPCLGLESPGHHQGGQHGHRHGRAQTHQGKGPPQEPGRQGEALDAKLRRGQQKGHHQGRASASGPKGFRQGQDPARTNREGRAHHRAAKCLAQGRPPLEPAGRERATKGLKQRPNGQPD